MAEPANSPPATLASSQSLQPTFSATSPRAFVESQIHVTHSEEETIALGRHIGPGLQGTVLLIGDLGAGKTTLTKGIVEGRGVAPVEQVSSPTFTLIHQYGG